MISHCIKNDCEFIMKLAFIYLYGSVKIFHLFFSFQSKAKPCEATLSPPIFTSCYTLVTFCLQLRDEVEAKLYYEDREALADCGLLAVASATKRLEKL